MSSDHKMSELTCSICKAKFLAYMRTRKYCSKCQDEKRMESARKQYHKQRRAA